jgi:hypothetical protein
MNEDNTQGGFGVNEWMSEFDWVNDWVNEWMSESVNKYLNSPEAREPSEVGLDCSEAVVHSTVSADAREEEAAESGGPQEHGEREQFLSGGEHLHPAWGRERDSTATHTHSQLVS